MTVNWAPASEDLPCRLQIGKSMGAGAYAVVHRAVYDGQHVALKVLLPQHAPSGREDCPVKMFIREGELLRRLDHSHVVRCLAVLELPPSFPGLMRGYVRPTWALVLELLESGSLSSLMHKQLQAPWKFLYDNATALEWSTQIAAGLAYLHGCSPPIIHRDMKLDNVMLSPAAGVSGGKWGAAKVVDLGLHTRPLTLERCTRQTLLRAPLSCTSQRSLAYHREASQNGVQTSAASAASVVAALRLERGGAPRSGGLSAWSLAAGGDSDTRTRDPVCRSRTLPDLSVLFYTVQHPQQSTLPQQQRPNSRSRGGGGGRVRPPSAQRLLVPYSGSQAHLALSQGSLSRFAGWGPSAQSGRPLASVGAVGVGSGSVTALAGSLGAAAAGAPGGVVGAAGDGFGFGGGEGGCGPGDDPASRLSTIMSMGAPISVTTARLRMPDFIQLSEAGEAGETAALPGVTVPSAGGCPRYAATNQGSSGSVGDTTSAAAAAAPVAPVTSAVPVATAASSVSSRYFRGMALYDTENGDATRRKASLDSCGTGIAAVPSSTASAVVGSTSMPSGYDSWRTGARQAAESAAITAGSSSGGGAGGGSSADVTSGLGARPPGSVPSLTIPEEAHAKDAVSFQKQLPPGLLLPAAAGLVARSGSGTSGGGGVNSSRPATTGSRRVCSGGGGGGGSAALPPRTISARGWVAPEESTAAAAARAPAAGLGGGTTATVAATSASETEVVPLQVVPPPGLPPSMPPPSQPQTPSSRADAPSGARADGAMFATDDFDDLGNPDSSAAAGGASAGSAALGCGQAVAPREVKDDAGGGTIIGFEGEDSDGEAPGSRPATARDVVALGREASIDGSALEVVYPLTGETGSCMTMAPEIRLQQPYNEKIDVYAFGVILYELWSRSLLAVSHVGTRRPDLPYIVNKCTDWPDLIVSGYRPARPDAIPGPVWELISECWDADPLLRPTMAAAEARLRRMAEEQAEEVMGLASGKGGKKITGLATTTGHATRGKKASNPEDESPAEVPSCGCVMC